MSKPSALSSSTLVWWPATKLPPTKRTQTSVTLMANRHMSRTESIGVSDSAPILMRMAEPATRLVKGVFGTSEANPQAGRFHYEVGIYRRYDRETKGFETARGYETTPDAWAYLPAATDWR